MSNAWQPSASIENLKARAVLIASIRAFFIERGVMEVETPLLSQHTVTDIHIDSFETAYRAGPIKKDYFLQTSPEFAMKRLLAAGSGPIFQICKAFRQGECGQQHNPEFSMLEWYRPGFNHHDLMREVDALLQQVLNCLPAEYCSYQNLFLEFLQIDPLNCETSELISHIKNRDLIHHPDELDRDTALQLLLTHCIEPHIGLEKPLFVYDFPASQAALAKVRNDNGIMVAERFEAYYKGLELANGFHELLDAKEQQQRFEKDLTWRAENNHATPEFDPRLIAALQHGLPECAGVAVGIDRLVMLATNVSNIADVISFDWLRA